MNVAIIGCGLIGGKRAKELGECKLVVCADKVLANAQKLANSYPKCIATDDWQQIANMSEIDIVIIATPHNSLAEITLAMVKAKKHVLVEKPAACRASDLDIVIEEAKKNNVLVRVG